MNAGRSLIKPTLVQRSGSASSRLIKIKCPLFTPAVLALDLSILYQYYSRRLGQGLSQQTQNMCITFIQRRPEVYDVAVGPTLNDIV